MTRLNTIKPELFRAWLDRMKWTDSDAGRALGCTRAAIRHWKQNGPPYYVAVACAALEAGDGFAPSLEK